MRSSEINTPRVSNLCLRQVRLIDYECSVPLWRLSASAQSRAGDQDDRTFCSVKKFASSASYHAPDTSYMSLQHVCAHRNAWVGTEHRATRRSKDPTQTHKRVVPTPLSTRQNSETQIFIFLTRFKYLRLAGKSCDGFQGRPSHRALLGTSQAARTPGVGAAIETADTAPLAKSVA